MGAAPALLGPLPPGRLAEAPRPGRPRAPRPPKGLKRAVTVYVCDVCDGRALGEQYCPECRTFRRAAGLGGPCPACDEPIALSELSEAVIGASMV